MGDKKAPHPFPTGNWDVDFKHFQADFSIRNFIAMRKSYQGQNLFIPRYSGIEQLYALKPLLEKFEIETVDVAACMDADPIAIDRVTIKLLALLADRQEREAAQETALQSRGEAIGDGLINYLICIILESQEHYSEPVLSASLFRLIREQLGGQNKSLHRSYQKISRRGQVVEIIASARKQGWECSLGQVATLMSVNKSSLSRMFETGELEKLIGEAMARPTLEGFVSYEDEDPIMRALPRKVREQRS